ncbi:MAG: cell division protein SepF [Clostridiales Family XIII bacterium]|jgi:cell division inhibitor SepF|nr:cell division protein SepF [Clostridiales Family XIII bacterium]
MADNILSKLKNLVGIEEFDDDEEAEEASFTPMERKTVAPYNTPAARPDPRETSDPNKVISLNKTLNAITSQFNLIVTEPKSFDECPKLVDSLKSRKPIIINLEKIETETAKKVFDFLSGATYALNGNMQKIANNIFVFVPENVNVSTAGSVEHKGVDFGPGTKSPWR